MHARTEGECTQHTHSSSAQRAPTSARASTPVSIHPGTTRCTRTTRTVEVLPQPHARGAARSLCPPLPAPSRASDCCVTEARAQTRAHTCWHGHGPLGPFERACQTTCVEPPGAAQARPQPSCCSKHARSLMRCVHARAPSPLVLRRRAHGRPWAFRSSCSACMNCGCWASGNVSAPW